MMPAILWKEYREHRLVWTVLAFISAATVLSRSILLGASWLQEHSDARENLCVLAVLLVGVYALICGAMMLAGEHENRTMSYLDALPGLRRRLWLGKFLAGVLLVLGQIVLLMCLAAAVSLFQNWRDAALTLAGMVVAGLYGLSWGMLFSSFGRSVMTVILLSLAGQVVTYLLTGLLAGFVFLLVSVIYGAEPDRDPRPLWAALFTITAPGALIGSALVFTRLDRRRERALRGQGRTPYPTWPMLFWLTWRQARGFAAGLAAFALFLGFLLPLQGLILWPVVTLVVGALCGRTAFADEQQGSFRFLGDQRLPLGRLWVVKVGVRFGIAVAAALLVLAPSFIAALANIPTSRWNNSGSPYHFFAHVFQSDLLVDLCPPGLFLTLWLVYGFSTGCLYGLLFRHGLAAGVFALFTCSLTAALWIPSLLGGGLHAWQVFGPPVLLLIATRLLMRPWASGRIASWTTALRLTPFVALAGLWIAGGLWYRVLEIPYVAPKIDLDAFRASLPTPKENEGGRLFRSACLRFDDLSKKLRLEQAPQGGAAGVMMPAPAAAGPPGIVAPAPAGGVPGMAAPMAGAAVGQPSSPPPMEMERARNALEHGWPADDHALAIWLDKMYAGEWAPMLKKAAALPTGPFDDVRNMTMMGLLPTVQPARELAVILAVRGLQRQAAGDDEAYVENLRIGLSLSRSLRDHTPWIDWSVGRAVESVLIGGLDRWLEKLHGRSDLIRQALALLSRHLDETAAEDGKDQEAIEALVGKNTKDDPLSLLQDYLGYESVHLGKSSPSTRDEAEWIATAWLVPWERVRQDRIFRVMFDGDQKQQRWLISRGKDFGPLAQLVPSDMMNRLNKPGALCTARAMQLKLALRWFQTDNGKPAENLDELVPNYLPSIPLDPYDGEPFRYRLSRGEVIEWPSDPPDPNARAMPAMGGQPGAVPAAVQPPTRKIPAGQGVLWCVGEDKVDDGGHRQSRSSSGETAPGGDIVFLVPLPPKVK